MLIHIDMSGKFFKKSTIAIAWVSKDKTQHKGIALSGKLIKKLIKNLNVDLDYPRLYAICVYFLIKNDLEKIKKIVICDDEPFTEVKLYLDLLFSENEHFLNMQKMNLRKYREELGKNIKSLADSYATSYRKRALKPKQKFKGRPLNVVAISLKMIEEVWNKIEKKL